MRPWRREFARKGIVIVSQTRANTLRLAALLGFIAGMPVLAIPAVNNSVDEWLFPAASPVDTLPVRIKVGAGDRVGQGDKAGTGGKALAGGKPGAGGKVGEGAAASASAELASLGGASTVVERLPPPDIPISSNRFEAVQRRLQELGAVYFRLEDTGGSAGRYRFRCELPLPGNTTYLRPFEHEDADPHRAMQAVLDEVELWLAAKQMRPPPTGAANR